MGALRCTLQRIKYSGARYWSVAEVLRHDVAGLSATACGPLVGCSEGDSLELSGEWVEDPKFGAQFKFKSAKVVLPSDAEGIVAWLCKLPEIGRNRAIALVSRFSAEGIFDVIEHEHERLAEVDGITVTRSSAIRDAYLEVKGQRQVQTFLRRWQLTDWQVTQVLAWAADEGIADIEIAVREQPYRLTQIDGFGFLTVDRIARRMGVVSDHIERARAAALYLLDEAKQEGHCFLPLDELKKRAWSKHGVPGEKVAEAVLQMTQDHAVDLEYGERVYLFELGLAEERLADRVSALLSAAALKAGSGSRPARMAMDDELEECPF